ncbi:MULTISPECIES: fimbria/pilus periplasmic chaperone [Enterobacterales]|uniref:fimbria/pilus periplasmic chaperone n=1 Tax=Enterobacterales TaxID=91347 RepID=UPI00084808A1|nr:MULTISPECIES: fimbria/pilus periplasmic chaperone [Enterobacterales]WOO48210.1 fimbria/pilus periplasmic chaperone [Hafnia alvei]MCT6516192.1 fimbria/pilus periplasmic chaperone [Proteus vulgaris]ODQ05326.1 molecular chaperone [Shigella sp. FC130]OEI92777.1 molecular chaperone [Shigella sp. FC1655]WPF02673.1 fimbria/pilus periplasmic chaperone [Proteus vulgaris]
MYLMYRNYIFLFFLFCFSSFSYAGGVALAATRIIYPMDAKQTSITINNTDKKLRFLVQSWIDDNNDKKTDEFIVTPPLFVSKPESENKLRIIYAGKVLPTDRESLFWLNTKAIPEIEREDIKDKNILQLAVLSRIKIFIRPQGLEFKTEDIPNSLEFIYSQGGIVINNPTPYYATLINIKLGDERLNSTMVPPKGSIEIKINNPSYNQISYQTINDYGASTPTIIKKVGK